MGEDDFRLERDSLGDVQVPTSALYGAQTQRAVNNFQMSTWRFSRPVIRALALIKRCAAEVNHECQLLDGAVADAIVSASAQVEDGRHDAQFQVDVFQTGSGTSLNMNANEVIANLARQESGQVVHPNDHVNMSQSSNDVIPSTIHISVAVELTETLIPSLTHLASTIADKAVSVDSIVMTGRTHLMDALPIRLSQALGGWRDQITRDVEAIQSVLPRLAELPLGGTAVGTGLNAPPEFGVRMAAKLARSTGVRFVKGRNAFALISSQDTAVEVSGHLKTLAVTLIKIANDLRWMNSGPLAGLGEIGLPSLQPGSSMMPGKVNPVIPEAVAMSCAQVVGHDAAVTIAGQSGAFQLNTMLPLIAHNVSHSVSLLANASRALADKAVAGFVVNVERIRLALQRNPILVTALAPRVGYDISAQIAHAAYASGRAVRDVAAEMTDLTADELDRLLNPSFLTEAGLPR